MGKILVLLLVLIMLCNLKTTKDGCLVVPFDGKNYSMCSRVIPRDIQNTYKCLMCKDTSVANRGEWIEPLRYDKRLDKK